MNRYFLRTITFLLTYVFLYVPCMGEVYAQQTDAAEVSPISQVETSARTVATINVFDASIVHVGAKTIDAHFTIHNRVGAQPGVRYAVVLTENIGSTSARIVDRRVYEPILSFGENESKTIVAQYEAPGYLEGVYDVRIEVVTTEGMLLGAVTAGQVSLSRVTSAREVLSNCIFVLGEKEYESESNIAFNEGEAPVLVCTLQHDGAESISVIPRIQTYLLNMYGPMRDETVYDLRTIEAGTTTRIELPLTLVREPGVYGLALRLSDTEGSDIATMVWKNYTYGGNFAHIQNLVFDKSAYEAGETATLSLFWFTPQNFGGERFESHTSDIARVRITVISEGEVCGTQENVPGDVSGIMDISVPLTRACAQPEAQAVLLDSAGKMLAERTFTIRNEEEPVSDVVSETPASTISLYVYTGLSSTFALLFGLTLLYVRSRRRAEKRYDGEWTKPVLLITLIFGGFGFLSAPAQADTMVVNGWPITVNVGASTYYPGEYMNVTAALQGGFSANWTIRVGLTYPNGAYESSVVVGPSTAQTTHTINFASNNSNGAPATPGNYSVTFDGIVYQNTPQAVLGARVVTVPYSVVAPPQPLAQCGSAQGQTLSYPPNQTTGPYFQCAASNSMTWTCGAGGYCFPGMSNVTYYPDWLNYSVPVDTGSAYTWTCSSDFSPTVYNCSANKNPTPQAGVCGSTHYSCLPGTAVSTVNGVSQYEWSCDGLNGGASSGPCIEVKVECNDGVDNDGTGGTDLADADCTSPSDTTETASLPPPATTNLTSNLDPLTANGTRTQGQSVTFNGRVRNSGSNTINTSFSDNFTYCWGTGCTNWTALSTHAKTVPLIAGGTQNDLSASLTLTSTGTLRVQHCVDSTGAVAESDESVGDNCTVTDFTVSSAAPPVPAGLNGVVGACSTGAIALTWSTTSSATSYTLRDGAAVIYTGPNTSFSHTGLANSSIHTYTVRASNSAGDSNYSAQVSRTASGPCPQPNLRATAVAVIDGVFTRGGFATFSGTEENNGGASASSGYDNRFSYQWNATGTGGFVAFDTRPQESLPAGSSQSETSVSLNFAQSGILYIRYCTDVNGEVADPISIDDCFISGPMVVAEGNLTSNLDPLTANGTRTQGQSVTFNGRVRNSGSNTINTSFSDNFTYCWGTGCTNWTALSTHAKTVPLIAGGTQNDLSASLTLTSTGTLRVQHCVDSTGAVAESDESVGDNCTVTDFFVASPSTADLIPVFGPSLSAGPYTQGVPITLTGRVRNQGNLSTVTGFTNAFRYAYSNGTPADNAWNVFLGNEVPKPVLSSNTLASDDTVSFIPPTAGNNLYIGYFVDSNNNIVELGSGEGNNFVFAGPFVVGSGSQCSDGVDNSDSEDVLIDLLDPGCVNAADTDETNLACQGALPANTAPWDADESADVANLTTMWTFAVTDTSAKCQYTCDTTLFYWNGSACVQRDIWSTAGAPPSGAVFETTNAISFTGSAHNSAFAPVPQGGYVGVEIDWNSDGTGAPGEFDEYFAANSNAQLGSFIQNEVKAINYTLAAGVAPSGTHRYRFNVDSTNALPESDEINNRSPWVSFTVNAASVACGSAVMDNCYLNGALHNETKVGQCTNGYAGTCTYTCNNSNYTEPRTNTCSPASVSALEVCDSRDLSANCADSTDGPKWVNAGAPLSFYWTATNATYCQATGLGFSTANSVGPAWDDATANTDPNARNSYSIACGNVDHNGIPTLSGSARTVEVRTNPVSPDIRADKIVVESGTDVTITWSYNSADATKCMISGPGYPPNPATAAGASLTFEINAKSTYTLNCGSTAMSDSVTIEIRPSRWES